MEHDGDLLADVIRTELASFRQTLLGDVEKALVRTQLMTCPVESMNGHQSSPCDGVRSELRGPGTHISAMSTQHLSRDIPDAWEKPPSPGRDTPSSPDCQPAAATLHDDSQRSSSRGSATGHDSQLSTRPSGQLHEVHDKLMAEAVAHHLVERDDEKDDLMAAYQKDLESKGQTDESHELPLMKEDTSFMSVFSNDVDLSKPIYDVDDYYHMTGFGQHVARNAKFAAFTQCVICINAVYLGIDSDYNDASNLYLADWSFIISENLFCFFFTFEWLVRFFAFKSLRDCFRDGWMRFDSFLVVSMVLETWFLMPIIKYSSGDSVSLPLGPLRLLRLLKITRMARLMRAFPELVILVKGIARSLRAISGSLILVIILLYTFAIFLHMLMKNQTEVNYKLNDELSNDFESMTRCMWTLFTGGVFLDGFADVTTILMQSTSVSAIVAGWTFIVFAVLTAATILNMLIGVLCEVVAETTREHAAAKDIAVMKSQIHARLRVFDDGDGLITQSELSNVLKDPHSKAVLRSLNINELFLLQMLKLMYPKGDSAVSFKPLTEIMLMCRGDNQATVETLASGFSYLVNEVRDLQASTVSCIASISAELKHLR